MCNIMTSTRIIPLACGYLMLRPSVEYTEDDLAWFRRPIREAR